MDEEIDNKIEHVQDVLTNFLAQHRGIILELMVNVEDSIDVIITEYFCYRDSKKIKEFNHLILASQSFNLHLKVIIINYLLSFEYKDILEKYKTFKDDIDDMVKLRNNFAHRKFDFFNHIYKDGANFNIDEITLSYDKTKDGTKLVTDKIKIDKASMSEYIGKIKSITLCLDQVISTFR